MAKDSKPPIYIGGSHQSGNDITVHVKTDEGKHIETVKVEGGEMYLCDSAMSTDTAYKFEGMTNLEMIHEMFKDNECTFDQKISHPGDFIIRKTAVADKTKYSRSGTSREIVNAIQSDHGGRTTSDATTLAEGGEIVNYKVYFVKSENRTSLNSGFVKYSEAKKFATENVSGYDRAFVAKKHGGGYTQIGHTIYPEVKINPEDVAEEKNIHQGTFEKIKAGEIQTPDDLAVALTVDHEKDKLANGKIKTLFLHGYRDVTTQPLVEYMREHGYNVVAPEIDYDKSGVWSRIMLTPGFREGLSDLIIGHSAGAYLGYYIGQEFNIPVLMLSPAFDEEWKEKIQVSLKSQNRPYSPANKIAVIGSKDTDISVWVPEFLEGKAEIHTEDMGHQVPLPIFEKYLDMAVKTLVKKEGADKSTPSINVPTPLSEPSSNYGVVELTNDDGEQLNSIGKDTQLSNTDGNFAKGGFVKPKEATPEELRTRLNKKINGATTLANNMRSLKISISKDLKSDNEKERLTALIVALMLKSGERIGNDNSAAGYNTEGEKNKDGGHYGISGFRKKHVKIVGDKVYLDYTGKSGVDHEKEFTDHAIAKNLKWAIKNSPKRDIFVTSKGFKINAAKVNRYLSEFQISAKDIRGLTANKWILDKLKSSDIPKEEADRKKKFLEALKSVAKKVGHGRATLKTHYLLPEIEEQYIEHGKIADIKKFEEGGSVTSDSTTGYLNAEQIALVNTPAFKKWSDNWKNVIKDDKGEPKVLFHGTTHKFFVFNSSRGNVQNHFGLGYYFTDSLLDVQTNYLKECPDLTQRIKLLAERFEQDESIAHAKAVKKAEKELKGKDEAILRCFVKMANPLDLTEKGTTYDALEVYDEDNDEYNENPDSLAVKLYNAIMAMSAEYDFRGIDGQKIFNEISEKIGEWDGTRAVTVDSAFRECESSTDIIDNNGDLASNEFIRRVYEEMGFDGIVMDADKAFGHKRKFGQAMQMDEGTKHYIVFNSNQIKLADGTNTTFDESNPDIRYKTGGAIHEKSDNKLIESPAFKKWFNGSQVVNSDGTPKIMYHGTLNDFNVFDAKKVESGWRYKSIFFINENKDKAVEFAGLMRTDGDKRKLRIIECFVSANNIFDIYSNKEHLDIVKKYFPQINNDKQVDILLRDSWAFLEKEEFVKKKLIGKYDGVYVTEFRDGVSIQSLGVFKSSQIKLADGTNTTFDGDNPDIRYEEGGEINDDIIEGEGQPTLPLKFGDSILNQDWDLMGTPKDELYDYDLDNHIDLRTKDDVLKYAELYQPHYTVSDIEKSFVDAAKTPYYRNNPDKEVEAYLGDDYDRSFSIQRHKKRGGAYEYQVTYNKQATSVGFYQAKPKSDYLTTTDINEVVNFINAIADKTRDAYIASHKENIQDQLDVEDADGTGEHHSVFKRLIAEGRISASDAATIIESAGLEVPKDIWDVKVKEFSKGGKVRFGRYDKNKYATGGQIDFKSSYDIVGGIIPGNQIARIHEAGYEFIKGDLKKGSDEYYVLVGKITGGKAQRFLGRGITIRKIADFVKPEDVHISDYDSFKYRISQYANESTTAEEFAKKVKDNLREYIPKYFQIVRRDIFKIPDADWISWTSSGNFDEMAKVSWENAYPLLKTMETGGEIYLNPEQVWGKWDIYNRRRFLSGLNKWVTKTPMTIVYDIPFLETHDYIELPESAKRVLSEYVEQLKGQEECGGSLKYSDADYEVAKKYLSGWISAEPSQSEIIEFAKLIHKRRFLNSIDDGLGNVNQLFYPLRASLNGPEINNYASKLIEEYKKRNGMKRLESGGEINNNMDATPIQKIKEAQAQAEATQLFIKKTIEDACTIQNPDVTHNPDGKSFTISSSKIGTHNWEPRFHDYREQKQHLFEAINATDLANLENRLREIFATHKYRDFKFNPDFLAGIQHKLYGDEVVQMENTTDLTVAKDIRKQIGEKALFMLGADNFAGDEKSLSFRIKGSNNANLIKITLTGADDYTMEFGKIWGGRYRIVNTVRGVYADMLNKTIEENTGLNTVLFAKGGTVSDKGKFVLELSNSVSRKDQAGVKEYLSNRHPDFIFTGEMQPGNQMRIFAKRKQGDAEITKDEKDKFFNDVKLTGSTVYSDVIMGFNKDRSPIRLSEMAKGGEIPARERKNADNWNKLTQEEKDAYMYVKSYFIPPVKPFLSDKIMEVYYGGYNKLHPERMRGFDEGGEIGRYETEDYDFALQYLAEQFVGAHITEEPSEREIEGLAKILHKIREDIDPNMSPSDAIAEEAAWDYVELLLKTRGYREHLPKYKYFGVYKNARLIYAQRFLPAQINYPEGNYLDKVLAFAGVQEGEVLEIDKKQYEDFNVIAPAPEPLVLDKLVVPHPKKLMTKKSDEFTVVPTDDGWLIRPKTGELDGLSFFVTVKSDGEVALNNGILEGVGEEEENKILDAYSRVKTFIGAITMDEKTIADLQVLAKYKNFNPGKVIFRNDDIIIGTHKVNAADNSPYEMWNAVTKEFMGTIGVNNNSLDEQLFYYTVIENVKINSYLCQAFEAILNDIPAAFQGIAFKKSKDGDEVAEYFKKMAVPVIEYNDYYLINK